MPRPKSFDEDAVLDEAVELFWQRGYEGTSLADLEAHLGLGRQSLYNTFGDKQTLFAKVLERYERRMASQMLAPLNAPGAGLEAIRTFFRESVKNLTSPGPRRACMVVNTILERGSEDADTALRCNHAKAKLERIFRRVLTEAKSRGELVEGLDVETTATLLVVQHYGLNVVAKTGATAEELGAAVEALLAGLGK
jgi:TetR/AcrR family transcriptional regulator, transcriptional repressor for nem operon